MSILMKIGVLLVLGAAGLMLLIMALAVCLVIVGAVATGEWLLLAVMVVPLGAFFCMLGDTE